MNFPGIMDYDSIVAKIVRESVLEDRGALGMPVLHFVDSRCAIGLNDNVF